MKDFIETIQAEPVLGLLLWMFVMSTVLFFMMGADKRKAQRNLYRIPEKRLFLFAIFGGAIGGTMGMTVFHHKTKHWYFAVGFPALAVLQTALCVLLYIKG